MPNHVTNRVTLFGKRSTIIVLLAAIANEEEQMVIDFEKIKKMPEVLHEIQSPVQIVTPAELKKQLADIEERRAKNPDDVRGFQHGITKRMEAEYIKKYGTTNWYDWHCLHWGTKWNAYNQDMINNTFMAIEDPESNDESDVEAQFIFDTAWATPFNVLKTLSEQYPDIEIKVEYADEDCGYNCGIYTLKDGEIIGQHEPEGGTKQAMDIYFSLHEDDKENYDLVDGEYIYKTPDEYV